MEHDESIQGRVSLGSNSTIEKGALVRGPVIIGENVTVKEGVYIGPYTSIGNNVVIQCGEIEDSIIMNDCTIDVDEKIVDSLIASHSKLMSSRNNRPHGRRFILGERCYLEL